MNRKISLFTVGFIWLFACITSCNENSNQSENQIKNEVQIEEKPSLAEQGNDIAKQSFLALSGQLKSAIQTKGISEAIKYCNVNAIPLTDSLSNEYEVKIQRLSDKNRNPENILSAEDSIIFAEFKANPELTSKVEKNIFYKPILTKPLCLNCHGEIGKTLPESNHKMITELYPDDKATGYKTEELRGLWKIVFTNP